MGELKHAALLIPVLLALTLLEYWVSRRKNVQAYSFSDTMVNICCGMLERLFDLFWVVMLYFVFKFLYEHVAPWQLPSNPLVWIIALFVGDFLAYWHHRLSHEINVFWAAHIVHHQSEELNISTVFRVSAFAVINRSFFWIWLPIAGFSPEVTTSVLVFIGAFQLVTHTRLVGKLGWLEYLFVTPSHHRVHHARNEKYLDKNYGHVFIIWDKMLGTFVEEDEEPDYGITTGFDSANPYRAYLHYWGELFRKAKETPRWQDKLKVFISPPDFQPAGAAPTPAEYQVDAQGRRVKQHIDVPFRVQLYLFFNVPVTLAAFVALMQLKYSLSALQITTLCVLVAFSALSHGLTIEQRRRALAAEYARLALLFLAAPLLLWTLPYSWVWIPLAWFMTAVFTVWFLRLRNYFSDRSKAAVPAAPQVAHAS